MRLYLIRHAQSTNNILTDERQRTYDPDLTPIGYQQANILARALLNTPEMPTGAIGLDDGGDTTFRLTQLYCSPMWRALLTTRPLAAAFGLQPEVWVDIHEEGGLYLEHEDGTVQGFPGLTRHEMQRQFPGYRLPPEITDEGWWNPARGRESASQAMERAIRAAFALREQARSDARIALVTHGDFMSHLLKALLNQLPGQRHELYYAHYNTAITRIDFLEGTHRMLVHYVNRFEHLPPELRTW